MVSKKKPHKKTIVFFELVVGLGNGEVINEKNNSREKNAMTTDNFHSYAW